MDIFAVWTYGLDESEEFLSIANQHHRAINLKSNPN